MGGIITEDSSADKGEDSDTKLQTEESSKQEKSDEKFQQNSMNSQVQPESLSTKAESDSTTAAAAAAVVSSAVTSDSSSATESTAQSAVTQLTSSQSVKRNNSIIMTDEEIMAQLKQANIEGKNNPNGNNPNIKFEVDKNISTIIGQKVVKIKSICFDLDDTLWDCDATLARASEKFKGKFPEIDGEIEEQGGVMGLLEREKELNVGIKHDFTALRTNQNLGYAVAVSKTGNCVTFVVLSENTSTQVIEDKILDFFEKFLTSESLTGQDEQSSEDLSLDLSEQEFRNSCDGLIARWQYNHTKMHDAYSESVRAMTRPGEWFYPREFDRSEDWDIAFLRDDSRCNLQAFHEFVAHVKMMPKLWSIVIGSNGSETCAKDSDSGSDSCKSDNGNVEGIFNDTQVSDSLTQKTLDRTGLFQMDRKFIRELDLHLSEEYHMNNCRRLYFGNPS